MSYIIDSDVGRIRLLLNDVNEPPVFTDGELESFLTLEGGSVKRAAAQAIDTNADNIVLASRVFRTQDVQVDGAKAAEALRKRAEQLRAQADAEDAAVDEGYFTVVDSRWSRPELTELGSAFFGWP